MSKDLGVWLGALSTLALYSYLYKENPAYRFAEHLYVGLAAGYAVAVGFNSVRNAAFRPIGEGRFIFIIPCILGLLLYSRFIRRYAWMSRYPVAVLVGIGTGMSLRGIPSSQIIAQVRAAMVPLNSLNNILLVIGVLSSLIYFLFIFEHKGRTGVISSIGRQVMMIGFGATFATSIFDNFSLLIGTLNMLLKDWLGIVKI